MKCAASCMCLFTEWDDRVKQRIWLPPSGIISNVLWQGIFFLKTSTCWGFKEENCNGFSQNELTAWLLFLTLTVHYWYDDMLQVPCYSSNLKTKKSAKSKTVQHLGILLAIICDANALLWYGGSICSFEQQGASKWMEMDFIGWWWCDVFGHTFIKLQTKRC